MGAGASADFGVPTLRSVFKETHARQYLRQDEWLRTNLEETFWEPRGHTLETSDDSLTIEEMLTILRDWRLEESIPHRLTVEDQGKFCRSLYVLIERALFEGKSTKMEYLNPLLEFARSRFAHITWASFNWDCVFESSFWYSSGPPEPYARCNPSVAIPLADWHPGTNDHLFLKLHGGINWWMIDGRLTYVRFAGSGDLAKRWTDYANGKTPEVYPVILEPSYYKYEGEQYKILEPQWAAFLKALIEADCVLILGYSLPEGDVQARSKILTAFQANERSEWAVVDPSPTTCSRYRRLLGNRRMKTFEQGLAGFNNQLEASLLEAFACVRGGAEHAC